MTLRTPLYEEHLRLAGKMIDFAGYWLPVQYPDGIQAEHLAVRKAAGLFDVSHMGEIELTGRLTYAFLDYLLPRSFAAIPQAIQKRQALYSVMCAPDGTTIDDLLLYPLSPSRCLLVINAANIAADEAHLRATAAHWPAWQGDPADLAISNLSQTIAQLALQGPQSLAVLRSAAAAAAAAASVTPAPAGQEPASLDILAHLKRYQFTFLPLPSVAACGSAAAASKDQDRLAEPAREAAPPAESWNPSGPLMLVSRTGYTGEDGFEFYLDPSLAVPLWQSLLAAGARPAGLGARDTLRLEAALPLYGHELSRSITPREAGLDRFLQLDKPEFIGRTALLASPRRQIIGLIALGKVIPRAGYPVLAGGRKIGEVTSGTFSPSLSKGIALALVDRSALDPEADRFEIEIRGRPEPFACCCLPFVSGSPVPERSGS